MRVSLLHILASCFAFAVSPAASAADAAAPAAPRTAPLLTDPAGPAIRLPPAPPRPADAEAATYDRCIKLARDNPAEGRAHAQAWQASGGGHPADHCFAVALIGLGQHRDAASRLEKLAQAMVHAPPALRADVLDQAAQAWLLAGEPGRAYAAASTALGLRPDNADLLVDRAEAAGAAGWFDKAIADLDRVLKADPARVDALIYRASAHRALGQLEPAANDLSAALKLAPGSTAALLERGNLRAMQADLDGARRDWERVTRLAPGSAAGTAAKANIAKLEAGDPAPAPGTGDNRTAKDGDSR